MEKKISIESKLDVLTNLIRQNKTVYNANEAAEYLGIALSYLYKLTSWGILPFSKPNGKLIYFSKAGLDEWLMSNQSKSAVQKEIEAVTYLSSRNSSKEPIKTLKTKKKGD